jgi:MerR family copper efflux transcriptional regulator
MNIGDAAKVTGLPAKTIRYYEDIGLVLADRSGNGYRSYGEQQIHRLAFLQRARSLGFSIDECRELLSLYDDTHRASADVKRIALEKVGEIEQRIHALAAMRNTLTDLAERCHGDTRPDCPILEDLALSSRRS